MYAGFQADESMPYMQTALALYEANPSSSTLIPSPRISFEDKGTDYEVDGQELEEFNEVYYETYRAAAENLLDAPDWDEWTDEERLKQWKGVHIKAQSEAKRWYLLTTGE